MDKRFIGLLLALAALAVFFWWLPEPEAPEPDAWPDIAGNSFVLRGVRVFDGDTVHERADVLVTDGVVTAVSGKVPVPDGTPELAATGYTVLPALIDAHTHNFGSSRTDALRFGVGTQLDMFTAHTSLAAARAARESVAQTDEADLWSAGTMVTAPGGHGTQFGMVIPTLDDPADAPAFVAERVAEGSDFIKLTLEGGRGWREGGIPTLDTATLTAAIAAAHSHGKLAVVHVGDTHEAGVAVDAGADGLVHVFHDPMTPELLDKIVQAGVFVVPTLTVLESLAGRPNALVDDARLAPYLDPAQHDALVSQYPGEGRAQVLVNALASVRALHAAGVTLLAGSDAPNPGTAHGASLHRELALLVEAGLTPQHALVAATSAPARVFGLEDRGRIERGMRADLLLVRGDPLADVTATRAIAAVWKNGYRVARPRFDGAAANEPAPAVAPQLGAFDDGDDDWFVTTDAIMGGASEATLSVADGVLTIAATVKPGSPFPWAGAMKFAGGGGMTAADASAYETLTLRVRGEGVAQLLFFSGANAQGVPVVVPVRLDGSWQTLTVGLDDVAGLDRSRLRAVALTAGPAPTVTQLELDDMVLR